DPALSRRLQEAAPAGRDHRPPERRPSMDARGHRGLALGHGRALRGPGRTGDVLIQPAGHSARFFGTPFVHARGVFAGVLLVGLASSSAEAHTFEVTDTRLVLETDGT